MLKQAISESLAVSANHLPFYESMKHWLKVPSFEPGWKERIIATYSALNKYWALITLNFTNENDPFVYETLVT